MRAPSYLVYVGTETVLPEWLFSTSDLRDALHAVDVVVRMAPAVCIALYVSDYPVFGCILSVDAGRWTVRVPETLVQPAPEAMQGAAPGTSEPGLEPAIGIGIGGGA